MTRNSWWVLCEGYDKGLCRLSVRLLLRPPLQGFPWIINYLIDYQAVQQTGRLSVIFRTAATETPLLIYLLQTLAL